MSDFVDPYLDPTTGTLRNLIGARTRDALDRAEADLTTARLIDLHHQRIRPSRDLDELCAIHRYLFQDVYDWAGQVRTVDIRKNIEGADYFLPVALIPRAAGFTAQELAADDYLRGMGRSAFIERLAHHYDQLNYMHPFREGNGRTQRAFWDRVARDAGWQLSWLTVTGAVNDHASRVAAESQDLAPLIEMFEQIVTPRG